MTARSLVLAILCMLVAVLVVPGGGTANRPRRRTSSPNGDLARGRRPGWDDRLVAYT